MKRLFKLIFLKEFEEEEEIRRNCVAMHPKLILKLRGKYIF